MSNSKELHSFPQLSRICITRAMRVQLESSNLIYNFPEIKSIRWISKFRFRQLPSLPAVMQAEAIMSISIARNPMSTGRITIFKRNNIYVIQPKSVKIPLTELVRREVIEPKVVRIAVRHREFEIQIQTLDIKTTFPCTVPGSKRYELMQFWWCWK